VAFAGAKAHWAFANTSAHPTELPGHYFTFYMPSMASRIGFRQTPADTSVYRRSPA
jgi:hypothetical protein